MLTAKARIPLLESKNWLAEASVFFLVPADEVSAEELLEVFHQRGFGVEMSRVC